MTPERMARLVAAWVRFYTRRQPPAVAQRRSEEIDADLHDHIAHERAAGTGDRRIALSIAGRMVRGMAADASAHRPLVRVALATAIVLLVPLIASAPWSLADFVAAGVLVAGTGLLLEAAARRPRSLAYRAAAIADRRRRVPVRQRRRRARPRALRLPADRRGVGHPVPRPPGGADHSLISAVTVRIARPRMWPRKLKLRNAAVASSGTPIFSTSRAWTTKK